jgi:hypothetical protein
MPAEPPSPSSPAAPTAPVAPAVSVAPRVRRVAWHRLLLMVIAAVAVAATTTTLARPSAASAWTAPASIGDDQDGRDDQDDGDDAGDDIDDDIDDDIGLSPVTECVIVNGDGTFTAFFGYDNRTGGPATRPLGERNRLRGAAGGAPTTFATGRHVAVFSATSDDSRIAWRLDDRDAVATPRSVPCSTNPSMPEAPVTLLLMLAPALVTGWWIRRRQRLVLAGSAGAAGTTARPC